MQSITLLQMLVIKANLGLQIHLLFGFYNMWGSITLHMVYLNPFYNMVLLHIIYQKGIYLSRNLAHKQNKTKTPISSRSSSSKQSLIHLPKTLVQVIFHLCAWEFLFKWRKFLILLYSCKARRSSDQRQIKFKESCSHPKTLEYLEL